MKTSGIAASIAAVLLSPSGVLGSDASMCLVEVEDKWCGATHNEKSYEQVRDRNTLKGKGLAGRGMNFHPTFGWYVCGLAPHMKNHGEKRFVEHADKCLDACQALGDCAEISVTRNGCCFFGKSRCEGTMRTYDYKYKLAPCEEAEGGGGRGPDDSKLAVQASLIASNKRCKPVGKHKWIHPTASGGPGACIPMILSNKRCDHTFFNYNPKRKTSCGCIEPKNDDWYGCEPGEGNLNSRSGTSVFEMCRPCPADLGPRSRELLFASLPAEEFGGTGRSAGGSFYSYDIDADSTALAEVPCCKA